jgi:hypothetical protein
MVIVMMMPDRLDEIKKRLMIEQQSPASVDYNQAVDDLGNPIAKSVQPAIDPTEHRQGRYEAQNMGAMVGDIATAAVPSLLGMFQHGLTDPQRSAMMNQGNKYLQNRSIAETPTKSNMATISNEIGSPELVDIRNAIGEEPYVKELKGTSSGLVKGVPHKMFNSLTGERAIISVGSDNVARRIGEKDPVDMKGWVQDLGVGTATGTDVFGTKTI